MTAYQPAGRLSDALACAERAGFTGAVYGPAAFNPGEDRGVRQVFIYRRGICADRYVTTVRRQAPGPPAPPEQQALPENAAAEHWSLRHGRTNFLLFHGILFVAARHERLLIIIMPLALALSFMPGNLKSGKENQARQRSGKTGF